MPYLRLPHPCTALLNRHRQPPSQLVRSENGTDEFAAPASVSAHPAPTFVAVVDGTIITAALPAMASQFGDVERVSWVVASYLVASTVAAPVYADWGCSRAATHAAAGLALFVTRPCCAPWLIVF